MISSTVIPLGGDVSSGPSCAEAGRAADMQPRSMATKSVIGLRNDNFILLVYRNMARKAGRQTAARLPPTPLRSAKPEDRALQFCRYLRCETRTGVAVKENRQCRGALGISGFGAKSEHRPAARNLRHAGGRGSRHSGPLTRRSALCHPPVGMAKDAGQDDECAEASREMLQLQVRSGLLLHSSVCQGGTRMRLFVLFLLTGVLIFIFGFTAFAQAKHPFTFEDMMKLKRVGEPEVSPDGKWVIFGVVDVDLEANTKTPHIWVVPVGAAQEGGNQEKSGVPQVSPNLRPG